jgi:uncharacterized RDD family membrane protein YckC
VEDWRSTSQRLDASARRAEASFAVFASLAVLCWAFLSLMVAIQPPNPSTMDQETLGYYVSGGLFSSIFTVIAVLSWYEAKRSQSHQRLLLPDGELP